MISIALLRDMAMIICFKFNGKKTHIHLLARITMSHNCVLYRITMGHKGDINRNTI